MPWTWEAFRRKHAHALSEAQAKRASVQANAMLKSGAKEGVAIATAIKNAKGKSAKRKPVHTLFSHDSDYDMGAAD